MSTIGLGEVARYVAERKLPLKKLITHHFRLEQAAEAYKIFESGQTGKVVITWV
jgi:propanol-preferring alcohol dehydrogenase